MKFRASLKAILFKWSFKKVLSFLLYSIASYISLWLLHITNVSAFPMLALLGGVLFAHSHMSMSFKKASKDKKVESGIADNYEN